MARLVLDISISLDGYVAGPDISDEHPLGVGGEQLHEWAIGTRAWREEHGLEGGDTGIEDEIVRETVAAAGAHIMGRGMFGGGDGAWGDDPWNGWWGDDPPFRHEVFVVTHHAREPLTLGETTFTFVTDGVESAAEQARAAAGDKDVRVAGGGSLVQQVLAAGLMDEMNLHVSPILLGGGVHLFGSLGPDAPRVERTKVVESPAATHLTYRVLN